MATSITPVFSMIVPTMVCVVVFVAAITVGYLSVMGTTIAIQFPVIPMIDLVGVAGLLCVSAFVVVVLRTQRKKSLK